MVGPLPLPVPLFRRGAGAGAVGPGAAPLPGSGTSEPPEAAEASTTTARLTATPRCRPSASLIGSRRMRSIASLANSLGAASSAVPSMSPSGRVSRRKARCWEDSVAAPDCGEDAGEVGDDPVPDVPQISWLFGHGRPPPIVACTRRPAPRVPAIHTDSSPPRGRIVPRLVHTCAQDRTRERSCERARPGTAAGQRSPRIGLRRPHANNRGARPQGERAGRPVAWRPWFDPRSAACVP